MTAPTNEDWGKMHAKAWKDPEFRTLLEQDPTSAVKAYGKEVGKTFTQIVNVGEKPSDVHDDDLHTHDTAVAPPACC
ncbi:hypothetical protein [Ruegeria sp.]|uniref:hypothetical protein n=1 Tax=Ruegeria sp. TaxID=1879320 RepID=UPI002328C466|nr:hypothetical protein [Ruegeria sp.]MDA7965158.1 nitrile hydratase subunit alpha [Ruegeria sp.]